MKENCVDDRFLKNLSRSCLALNVNRVNASDELAVLRGESDLTKALVKLFKSKDLANSPTLTQLMSTVILFVPHNITVENGLINMKFYEIL